MHRACRPLAAAGTLLLLMLPPAASAAAPAEREPPPERLIERLPATLDELAGRGEPARDALLAAIKEGGGRKAVLTVALAAACNQLGDPAGAKSALRGLPQDADAESLARALWESALAAELSGSPDALSLYGLAADSGVREVSARALRRMALLHRWSGGFKEAKDCLARLGRAADEGEVLRAKTFVAAHEASFAAAAPILGGAWRPRLMDTFDANEVSFPGYGRFFADGWMHILPGPDGRTNRFPVGQYSGGLVRSPHLMASFACRLAEVVGGRSYTAGFAVRADGSGRTGVTVEWNETRRIRITTPEGSFAVEPAVFRPTGRNDWAVAAVGRRVEIRLNGLPLEVVHDGTDAAGGLELLSTGCVVDYDHYMILVPSDRKVDLELAWRLNTEALRAAAAGRRDEAIDKLVELLPLTEPDCESRVYLYRMLAAFGGPGRMRMIGDLWPDKIHGMHLLAAEQARWALALRGRKDGDKAGRLLAAATQRLSAGRPDEAVRIADEGLALIPGEPSLLDLRAEAHRVARRFDKAAEDCEAVLQADPVSMQPLARLAMMARASGRADAEVKAWERLLKAFPQFPNARTLMDEAKRRIR